MKLWAFLICVLLWCGVGRAQTSAWDAGLLDALATVEAASLHAQSIEDAPANVTVVTAEEIRRFGYRTLGEALDAVRGLYVTNDREYRYVGVRGFLLPGDFNTRFLVMINGHNMTENIYGSNNFFGQDFGLDLHLVKRIEVIRGPSSTLYGSNGILATINIVTQEVAEAPRASASVEVGSFGERKGTVTASGKLGGARVLVSGSLFDGRGRDFYFSEFDSPLTNYGRAVGVDGESAYHTFAQVLYRNWTLTSYFGAREKKQPTAPFGTIFNSESAVDRDARDFVELGYTREKDATTWNWHLYYDRYRFDGYWASEGADGIHEDFDYDLGSSVGTEVTYRKELSGKRGAITVGGEFIGELHALQKSYGGAPRRVEYLNLDTPDRAGAGFVQHEYPLDARTTLQWGVRLDASKGNGVFASPRLALMRKQSPRTTWKLLYGRAFRNPNNAEQSYDDGGMSQIPNRGLGPEAGHTFEALLEQKAGEKAQFTASVYHYRLNHVIAAESVDETVVQYRNGGSIRATGIEAEVRGRVPGTVDIVASGVVGGDHYSAWKARVGRPVARRFYLGMAWQYRGEQETRSGAAVPRRWIADATISGPLRPGVEFTAGVRNAMNRAYSDPVGYGRVMETIRQDGRSVFCKITWGTRD